MGKKRNARKNDPVNTGKQRKYWTKQELVDAVIEKRDLILKNEIISNALLDSLIPLSASDGKIKSINDDGTVTIEFSAPIQSYLDLLTRKKLLLILEAMEQE